MKNCLVRMIGNELSFFAFSHDRDVVTRVSLSGGVGVLCGSSYTLVRWFT